MGEFVEAGGVKTWFDSWGSGPPMVLLHGGFVPNATWEPMVPGLAERFHIFAPERRGHGHTPEVDGPFTFELVAEDTIAFLEGVVGEPAAVVGWSDGGRVGLMVASRRPDLVTRLVAISAALDNVAAGDPTMVGRMEASTGDEPQNAFLKAMYESTSPDSADHWPVVYEKIKRMILDEDTLITTDELRGITAPALIMASDEDLFRLEHILEIYRSIPNAQLAIVPGTSHALVMEKPDVIDGLILEFLTRDPMPTMVPIRRAPAGPPV